MCGGCVGIASSACAFPTMRWSWQVEYIKVGAVRVSPSAGAAARSLASAVFYVDGEPLPDTADGFEVPHEFLAVPV